MRPRRGSKIYNDNAPNHGVPDWLLVQVFYNGLDQSLKISENVVKGGALVEKLVEATKAFLEGMASNNYH